MNTYIEKMVNIFCDNKILDKDNKELCCYGLNQSIMLIFNLTIIVIIGNYLGLLSESIVFSLFYMFLRQYAGGYHARTQCICCVMSGILLFTVLICIKYGNLYRKEMVFLVLGCSVMIYILAPVEAQNKPLDSSEYFVFKNVTKVILFIEVVCGIVMYYTSKRYFECFAAALIVEAVMLVAGKVQLQRRNSLC